MKIRALFTDIPEKAIGYQGEKRMDHRGIVGENER